MVDWITEFYGLVDSGAPTWLDRCSPPIRMRVGNAPTTVGHEEPLSGPMGEVFGLIDGVQHVIRKRYDLSGSKSVLEDDVTYLMKDSWNIVLNVLTVIERDSEGLIYDLRLFYDPRPILAAA